MLWTKTFVSTFPELYGIGEVVRWAYDIKTKTWQKTLEKNSGLSIGKKSCDIYTQHHQNSMCILSKCDSGDTTMGAAVFFQPF
jgi:hypothetical protein